jgi:chromosomal replication initiator protein
MTAQTCQQVWDICLQTIRGQVSEQSFKTWFLPIVPVHLSEKSDGARILTIQVPTRYFYDWIEEHYVSLLEKGIRSALGENGRLQYTLAPEQPKNPSPAPNQFRSTEAPTHENGKPASDKNFFAKKESFTAHAAAPKQGKKAIESNLNIRHTFANFIEGDCNKLAVTAGQSIVQNPGINAFNPLVLYGGVGLGKTHLAEAIGNAIREQNSHKNVLYVSANQFGNDFVQAVRESAVQQFMDLYMSLDVLIVDDIQFFCGKSGMQENFFNVFNHLHQSRKQIIMTSDCAPKDLRGLQDRLLSRFKWGLTTELKVPSFETRRAIIDYKMKHEGIALTPEVLDLLANSITTNVREIEGALISLLARASLLQQEITLDLVQQCIQTVVKEEKKKLTLEDIQEMVAELFQITTDELKDKSRKKNVADARQFAMYIANKYTDLPLKTIGMYFGKRDHSTVIHACKAIPDKLEKEAEYKEVMRKIEEKIAQLFK